MSEKRFRFEKECTENFFTEKGVFYNNERPMGANEIIALLNFLYDENGQLKGISKNIVHQIDVTYKTPAPMSFAKVNLSLSEYDKLKEVCFK